MLTPCDDLALNGSMLAHVDELARLIMAGHDLDWLKDSQSGLRRDEVDVGQGEGSVRSSAAFVRRVRLRSVCCIWTSCAAALLWDAHVLRQHAKEMGPALECDQETSADCLRSFFSSRMLDTPRRNVAAVQLFVRCMGRCNTRNVDHACHRVSSDEAGLRSSSMMSQLSHIHSPLDSD